MNLQPQDPPQPAQPPVLDRPAPPQPPATDRPAPRALPSLPFADRAEAGRLLALELVRQISSLDLADPVVLALPRGGVPVAVEVARALKAPLDLLLVRKIGSPGNPELAVAAVSDGQNPQCVLDEPMMAATGADPAWVESRRAEALREIDRRRQRYLGARAPVPLAGRTVVLVDDGIATGTTARVAIQAARAGRAARVVLAVPVAAREALQVLAGLADHVVCLAQPVWFHAVGVHYRRFPQVGDDEVVALLAGLK